MTTNDSSPEPGRADQPPTGGTVPPHGAVPPQGTVPPTHAAWDVPPPRHESTGGFFDSLRRTGLWRGQDRWIGGVAAGVARRLDVDPLLVRGIFVVMSFFGGLGLLLYGLGWALLPEESDGRIHLQEALRGNVDAALAGAAAFVVVGIARPGTWWGGSDVWGGSWFLLGLAVVALVVIVVASLSRRGSAPRPPAAPPSAATGPGAAASWAGASGDVAASGTASAPGTGASGTGHPGTAASAGTAPQSWSAPPPPASTWGEARDEAEPTTSYGRAAYGEPMPGPGERSPYAAASSAPTTYHGPAGAVPYPAPQPPVPPRPRTPGPGSAVVAVVLALCLLATAGLLLWDLTDPQDRLLPIVIGGTVLILLGLGVMLSAVRGRRGGALSFLGVLVALVVVPATLASTVAPFHVGIAAGAGFGDRTVAPTSAQSASDGYRLIAGDLDVDLSELDLTGAPVTVPIEVGAGDVRVIVPEDTAVRVAVELGAGRIQGRTTGEWSGPMDRSPTDFAGPVTWRDGSGISATYRSPEAEEDETQLVVDVHVGAGNISIEEPR